MQNKSLENMVRELSRLPGVGKKSAERIAFFLLELDNERFKKLLSALIDAKKNIKHCELCHNFTKEKLCSICSDTARDSSILCIVENPKDLEVIEHTGIFKGIYHILNGKLSPLEGINADKLTIDSLMKRLSKGVIKEVIIALDSDLEGQTTALYLSKLIQPLNVNITKLATGVPLGGSIEFCDSATLAKAMLGRGGTNSNGN